MKKRRNTIAKTKVLDLLKFSIGALSHADIQAALGNVCDRVTIYRILNQLVEDDIVHKVVTFEGVVKYALCQHEHNISHKKHDHVHFSCEICEKVICLDHIKPEIKLPRKYKAKEYNFVIQGICPDCR